MPDNAAPGADDELHEILHGEYACTRSWEAWQYGTMTEADFTPMGETEIVADLIAWRDAAVASVKADLAEAREGLNALGNRARRAELQRDRWRNAFEALHARLLRDLPGDASELPPPDDEYWVRTLDDLLTFAAETASATEKQGD